MTQHNHITVPLLERFTLCQTTAAGTVETRQTVISQDHPSITPDPYSGQAQEDKTASLPHILSLTSVKAKENAAETKGYA